ncbi:hypothetical protein CA54_03400 [Symmachiella macrocystis]|uniref:Uncharacterized protein n=1 Tax=Symmachiella macrocystis TaxID=2527985 RepID=A0A5C6BHC4_9PLAN|nr:hypothetical protein [Symmachiella macrocystis]TWU11533.1 hypothetical protein CA54_03400 [Symmachiella macrocystis]
MTSPHPLLTEWQQRIDELNERIAAPSRSKWLFEIRAKILKYFVSRYGKQPPRKIEAARTQATTVRPQATTARRPAYFAAGTTTLHGRDLKSRATIRMLLDRIHQTVHPPRSNNPRSKSNS